MFSPLLSIEIGVITAWAGGLGNIPPNWFLCDGTNGTPDLRDEFIPGAGALFAVGDERGLVSHQHDFTSDGHTHSVIGGTDLNSAPPRKMPTTTDPSVGTTDLNANLPPFYALAYIQYQGP